MPKAETEEIVLLDDNCQPIGTAPKLASHNASTPLHLAFSCYIFNDEGKVLVTRRALSKKVWPGIWTNSCCGHPAPGETVEDAVIRRCRFELGLEILDLRVALPSFRYSCEFRGIVENEYCPVYVARSGGSVHPNPAEVESYEWRAWESFKADISAHGSDYSYWCKLQIPLLESADFVPITD